MSRKFYSFLLFFFVFVGSFMVPVRAGDPATTVAVVDFTNNSGKYLPKIEESAAEILSVLLVQTGKFNLVERDKLAAVMQEQGLTGSGLVDNSQTAIQIGRLLGAEYIITGSIVSYGQREAVFNGYGIQTRKTITEMTTSVKVLNVTSGKIEAASLFSDTVEQGDTGYLKTYDDNLTRTLLTRVLRSAVNQLVETMAPEKESTETVRVTFLSTPEGADVEINGVYYGSTPLTLQLNPGIHQVTISLAAYNPWAKKINAYDGLEVKATLEKKPLLEKPAKKGN